MDKLEAAQSIRRLAVQYQAMVAAADALEAVARDEDTHAVALRDRDAALKARDAALRDRDAALAAAEGARQEAKDIVAAAESNAQVILSGANLAADDVVAKARAAAQDVVDGANAAANGAHEAQATRESLMQAELDRLETEIASANARKLAADAEARDAQAALNAVRAALAQVTGAVN